MRPATRSGTRSLPELLIDCEADRTLRAVLVGMLREADRSGSVLGTVLGTPDLLVQPVVHAPTVSESR